MTEYTFEERQDMFVATIAAAREAAREEYNNSNTLEVISKARKRWRILMMMDVMVDSGSCNFEDETWLRTLAMAADDVKMPSYAKPDIKALQHHDFTDGKNRRKAKWGKFLRDVYGPRVGHYIKQYYPHDIGERITDEEWLALAEFIVEHMPDLGVKYEFEVVRGDVAAGHYPIYEVYAREYLGSCMYGERYVKWYDQNPEKVGCVVITKGDQYIGRALVWTTDEGQTVLDRVYPSNAAAHTRAVRRWAKAQGWVCKQQDSINTPFDDDCAYTVTMKPSLFGYPYLDTFQRVTRVTPDEVVISNNEHERAIYRLTSQGGDGPDTVRMEECSECCEMVDADDMVTVYHGGGAHSVCSGCRDSYYHYVESTTRANRHLRWEYHHDSDVTIIGDEAYLDDDCIMDYNGEAVFIDNAVTLHDGEYAANDDDDLICLADGEYAIRDRDSVVELANGEYVLEGEAILDYQDEYIHEGEAVELYDGDWASESEPALVTLHDGSKAIQGHHDVVELVSGDYALASDVRAQGDAFVLVVGFAGMGVNA